MVLINPSCNQAYRSPSLGMLYIAAYLRQQGIPVNYLDCNYHPDWKERLNRLLNKYTMAGITANVLSILPALDVARYIRQNFPSVTVAMGGPYPSVEYEKLIPEFADVVVIGEGEETSLEIAQGIPREDIQGIVYYKKNAECGMRSAESGIESSEFRVPSSEFRVQGSGLKRQDSESKNNNSKLRLNAPRSLISDLDRLPFPAWDMGDVKEYRLSHIRGFSFLPIMTSRGCPFRCIFCASKIIHRSRMRWRSIPNVIAETDEIYHRHGAREIHIWDDNFTLNPERTMELCDQIAERKYRGLHFAIPAGIKPDVGDEKLFRKMVRAGFYSVCIAVETGDQQIMNKLGKKVDLSKVKAVIKAARRAGLYTNGFFMLGLPFDTEETMERTIAFACCLPLNQALFFITMPFPGTELYEIALREGKFLYHVDDGYWDKGYFLGKASYEMPGFSAAQLERMYRRAYRRFFLRPTQMLRLLRGRVHSVWDLFYIIQKAVRVILKGRQF
ncbi:MAG: radical SAM protein [bacterium]